MNTKNKFMKRAIELSENSANSTGGPFGSVIVKGEKIISEGSNKVTFTNDPTAHAEIIAIRNACKTLDSFQLDDCEIYCSSVCNAVRMCQRAHFGTDLLCARNATRDVLRETFDVRDPAILQTPPYKELYSQVGLVFTTIPIPPGT